jgi:4Fe-4S ferredoxin
MPYKRLKQELSDVLMLEWVLQVKNFKLILDKHRCVGCQICSLVCPKDAIKVEKHVGSGEKALKSSVDIDLAKCNFCGICDVTCLYGAVSVTLNGVRNTVIVSNESYPKLDRIISLDSKNCFKDCFECETVCPWQLIKVSRVGFDGKPVENVSVLSSVEKRRVKVNVDIQRDYCPTCKICEVKCPAKVLKVTKIFEGKLFVNTDKCLVGCHNCVDVCPVPNVLTVNAAGKIDVNELYCTYCGACKIVCPISDDEALVVRRVKVAHVWVRSGTWNRVLGKLTSNKDGVKELKAVASFKKRNVILKRFKDEVVL